MANFKVGGEGQVLTQKSHLSRTIDEDGSAQLIALPESETKISLLGNLFMSEGDDHNSFTTIAQSWHTCNSPSSPGYNSQKNSDETLSTALVRGKWTVA